MEATALCICLQNGLSKRSAVEAEKLLCQRSKGACAFEERQERTAEHGVRKRYGHSKVAFVMWYRIKHRVLNKGWKKVSGPFL